LPSASADGYLVVKNTKFDSVGFRWQADKKTDGNCYPVVKPPRITSNFTNIQYLCIMLKLLLLSALLILIALVALSIRIILKPKGEFSGGKCSGTAALRERGIDCTCGGEGCHNVNPE
jgi:hypothetical protein